MTIRHIRIAYWMRKSTNTHLEYVILIIFPLQQWSHKVASILRYTFITCPVLYSNKAAEILKTGQQAVCGLCFIYV